MMYTLHGHTQKRLLKDFFFPSNELLVHLSLKMSGQERLLVLPVKDNLRKMERRLFFYKVLILINTGKKIAHLCAQFSKM